QPETESKIPAPEVDMDLDKWDIPVTNVPPETEKKKLPPIARLLVRPRTRFTETSNDDVDDTAVNDDQSKQPSAKKVLMRMTHLVAGNDTLLSIAEAYWHDPNVGWLIADLNKDQIKDTWVDGKRVVELRTRQKLSLPTQDEKEGFLRNRPKEARPENLVTIVEENQLDLELLSSMLGPVVGTRSEPDVQLPRLEVESDEDK